MKIYLFVFFLLFNLSLYAQQQTAPKAAPQQSKESTETGTPGPNHSSLENLVGNWVTSTKFMAGNSPAEAGTAVGKMILGGRFLWMETTGTQMGKPYNTVKITGYDNADQKYQSVWIDDEHTEMLQLKGVSDGKRLTLIGSFHGPENKPVMLKGVLIIKDKDHHVWEYYQMGEDAKESKVMEVTFTRKS